MALSIAFGAYATEIFRMSIQEIPIGQSEAAQAIGMRPLQTFIASRYRKCGKLRCRVWVICS